jgi:hypothetical protein
MVDLLKGAKSGQDWLNLILAIALFLSPWVIGFAADTVPAWNAWVVGGALIMFALATLSVFAEWEEWVNFLLGLWLALSPWLLGFAANANAMWTHLVMGLAVVVVTAWSIWDHRHTPHAHA